MKINSSLLERLSQSKINPEDFIKRLDQDKKQSVPEQFLNQSGNFRVRTLHADEPSPQPDLSKSFYNASQMTRSTAMSTTQASPHTLLSKHKVMPQQKLQTMISAKMQQSVYVKRTTDGEGTKQLRKLIPKPPLQLGRPLSSLNNSHLGEKSNSSRLLINHSQLNPILLQEKLPQQPVVPQQPVIAKMRGLSSMARQRAPEPQAVVSQRKVGQSLSKDTSNTSIKRRLIRNASAHEKDEVEKELPLHDIMNEDIVLEIAKTKNFDRVQKVSLRFNSQNDSLQMLGELLPNLMEVRLNNSIIASMRDLGTRMQGVRILWISRANLKDLSGFNALPNLRELYCGFNMITDLSPLAFHDKLEILDLEANDIADEMQIDYLETLGRLEYLNLTENPIYINIDSRFRVKDRLAHVELNEDLEDTDALSAEYQAEDDSESKIGRLYQLAQYFTDIEELKQYEEQIKEDLEQDLILEPGEIDLIAEQIKTQRQQEKKGKKQRPQTAGPQLSKIKERETQKPDNINQPTQAPDPTSKLIQDEILCGNPLKAARHKKKQELDNPRKSMDIRDFLKQYKKK